MPWSFQFSKPTRLKVERPDMRLSHALLLTRLLVLAVLLPVLRHSMDLPTLVGMLGRGGYRRRNIAKADLAVVRRVSALSRRLRIYRNCLNRSLLLYHLLPAQPCVPELVLGLGLRDDGQWIGHAWILLDGAPFEEENLAGYTPFVYFRK
jgi:hypothetical protein